MECGTSVSVLDPASQVAQSVFPIKIKWLEDGSGNIHEDPEIFTLQIWNNEVMTLDPVTGKPLHGYGVCRVNAPTHADPLVP